METAEIAIFTELNLRQETSEQHVLARTDVCNIKCYVHRLHWSTNTISL